MADQSLQCQSCHQSFTTLPNLNRHISFRCKSKQSPTSEEVGSRRPKKTKEKKVIKVDKELNDLLDTINSEYVKWRLAQVIGVTQRSVYPLLFHHSYPGSRASFLASVCPTENTCEKLFEILKDAANFKVDKLRISKNCVVVDCDGKEHIVDKYLTPSNSATEDRDRADRKRFIVEETEDEFVLSLPR